MFLKLWPYLRVYRWQIVWALAQVFLIEAVDNQRWRFRRCKRADNRDRLVARQAGCGDRRHSGHEQRRLRAGNCQRP